MPHREVAAGIECEPALAGKAATEPAMDELWGEPALAGSLEALADKGRHEAEIRNAWEAFPQKGRLSRFLVIYASSGLFAVLCALAKGTIGFGVAAIVVGAPVVEETSKIFLPALWVERKPWFFRSSASLVMPCLVSALIFASIENLLYLYLYIPGDELSVNLVMYRLIVCSLVHVACTAVSAYGLMKAWRNAHDRKSDSSISDALPCQISAMVLHGLYNAAAFACSFAW